MKSVLFSLILSTAASAAPFGPVATCRSVGPIQGHHNGHGIQTPIRIRLSYALTKAANRYNLEYTGPAYTLGHGTNHFVVQTRGTAPEIRPQRFTYQMPSAAVSIDLVLDGNRGVLHYSDGKPISLTARLVCTRFN